jgi:hypothetical protein
MIRRQRIKNLSNLSPKREARVNQPPSWEIYSKMGQIFDNSESFIL